MKPKVLGYNPHTVLAYALDILYDGKHGGSGAADGASVLSDVSNRRLKTFPFNDNVLGKIVYNLTDGSSGIITARTATTITATLANGTDNDWDLKDGYIIGGPFLNVQQQPYNSITTGIKTVTTAGTAERLVASSTPCKMVMIQNTSDQGDPSCIGDVNVVAAEATHRGVLIHTEDLKEYQGPQIFYIDDLYKLWVDVRVSGNSVTYTYFN